MLKYKITTTHGKHPIAEVRSEDERCVIAGEMLLAERGLLQNLLDAVNSVLKDGEPCASFAGNAFSAYITPDTTKSSNEITDGGTELPTADIKKLIKEYKRKNERIKR